MLPHIHLVHGKNDVRSIGIILFIHFPECWAPPTLSYNKHFFVDPGVSLAGMHVGRMTSDIIDQAPILMGCCSQGTNCQVIRPSPSLHQELQTGFQRREGVPIYPPLSGS